MVYLPTGRSDLFLILSCITSNLLYLSFLTLHYSSLWRTDTIVFTKSNKPLVPNEPPISISPPPPKMGEVGKPYLPGGLMEDLQY